ncbi:CooT family nickel-binding protein [Thiovibrio frasassiensis]|jgi:predicted RNA-binding protein|uniref:CooT family nickel-binding protein n=1 Tax=Thiovibrio frasassiensis TaxID=2984131 RepID=A0A9X4MEP6_9BACT|nr:CooT family nickel-binding protein [Thiovibrio frasassiensis]MDG4475332.1 CooT family nickel-binding protein [Thiovibrio frasassiensis]
MSIILVGDGKEEVLLENASLLEVTDDGVRVSALFEEPKFIRGAAVRAIDFLHGKVTVTKTKGAT